MYKIVGINLSFLLVKEKQIFPNDQKLTREVSGQEETWILSMITISKVMYLKTNFCKKKQGQNVHRFALSAIIGELLEKEREKEKERDKEIVDREEREREIINKIEIDTHIFKSETSKLSLVVLDKKMW